MDRYGKPMMIQLVKLSHLAFFLAKKKKIAGELHSCTAFFVIVFFTTGRRRSNNWLRSTSNYNSKWKEIKFYGYVNGMSVFWLV